MIGGPNASLVEKAAGADLQRCRKTLDHHDRGVPYAPFNVTGVGPVNARLLGKLFLRNGHRRPQSFDILTKALANIH